MQRERSDIKIAHISDLHCSGRQKWRDRFDNLIDCLCDEKPDALFVTGDLVDHPSRRLFRQVEAAFDALYKKALTRNADWSQRLQRNTFVICGNHDVAITGIHFLLPTLRGPFREFHSRQLKNAGFASIEEQAEAFYKETGIAVFPYDSNTFEGSRRGWAANGHIADLEEITDNMRDRFRSTVTASGVSYDDATKIALLHHHPLPLPADKSDIGAEPFMLLDNANHFLRTIAEHGIHLVLHGHRHVSGYCWFSAAQHPKHTVVVSSCGSSCKPSESTREIAFYKARHCGSITRHSFTASQEMESFLHDPPSSDAVTYGYRRKIRLNTATSDESGVIRLVRSKSKVVRLIADGSALVTIRHQGIEWKKDTYVSDIRLEEFIHGGIGRVVGGWMSWLDKSGARIAGEAPILRQFTAPANEYEGFKLPINHGNLPAPTLPDGCEICYVLFNGYCLTRRDYKETFGGGRFFDEVSSIEALYPTKHLELILAFPDRDLMPKANQVFLDAWHWPADEPNESQAITRKEYDVDRDETEYLNGRDAARHRSELCQVSVLIRHPQPRHTYTLRWLLPEEKSSPVSNSNDYERVTAALLGSAGLSTKWATIELQLQDILRSTGISVRVYAFDPGKLRMCLLNPTPDYQESEMVVGRGVIGHAFRTRSPVYYRHSDGNLSPLELMGSTQNLEEILAIPILHPIRNWQSADTLGLEPVTAFHKVSGVIAVVRRGDQDEPDVLDPDMYVFSDRFLTLMTRLLVDPILEVLR